MTSGPRSTLLRQFRTLFEAGTVAGLTDGQLLERFLTSRDEAGEVAFAALVARHGPMVLGVCRRALADPNDAADAFQATFLVLVRKARSVRVDDSLGRWLYGVSRRVANRARTIAARRPRADVALDRIEAASTDPDRFELASMLDEELARLPEAFRSAIVLCDLGGMTHEEAARDLLCPVGTIKSRLARGRKRLRERLERRGVAPSTMMPAPTVPASLADAAVRVSTMVMRSGSTAAGVVPASVAVLAQEVIKAMIGIKLKLAAAVVLSLGVVATGAGVLGQAEKGGSQRPSAEEPRVPGVTGTPPPVPVVTIEDKLDRPVTLTVADKPLFEVVNHLRDQTGVTIVLDMKSLSTAGLSELSRVSLAAQEISLRNAMKYLLQPLGLTFRTEDDLVLITAPAKRFGALEAKLAQPVTISVKDSPLNYVAKLLMSYTGLKIIFDPSTITEDDLKGTLVTVSAEGERLSRVLTSVLRPIGMDYAFEDDFLLIRKPRPIDRASRDQLFSDLYRELERARVRLAKAERISRDPKDPAIVLQRKRVVELESALGQLNNAIAILQDSGKASPKDAEPPSNPGRRIWPKGGTKGDPPGELNKVAMPDYVIEPPDVIIVEVLEALQGRPITGERLVKPDGKINLGFYGEVYVAGLTMAEVKAKVAQHLREYLDDEKLGLSRTDPKTGKVERVEPTRTDRIFVDVTAYNSKNYYVQGEVGVPGRLPITGNETVLDAINYAGGLLPNASKKRIRLVRPAPPGASGESVLPVDLFAIVDRGDVKTNYQLFPGDRLIIDRDPKEAQEKKEARAEDGVTKREADVEARLQAVEKKLDEVLKALDRLPKP